MSFSENNMVLPVSPMYGNNGGFGGWDSSMWLILIVLFAMGGFGGGYGMGGYGGFGGYDFPWLLNGQQNILNGVNSNTNAGFNQAATQSAINGLQNSVTSGFGDVQLGIAGVNQNICQTGNGIVNALNSGFASAEVGANARQMANMNQMYGISSQLAQCLKNGVKKIVDFLTFEDCDFTVGTLAA